jgi:prepilin-type processing-associated H-X9-DG protein
MSCSNNQKQYGLALHNYHDNYSSLPKMEENLEWPDHVIDTDYPPNTDVSIHVRVLPYIEQGAMLASFPQGTPVYSSKTGMHPDIIAILELRFGLLTCPSESEKKTKLTATAGPNPAGMRNAAGTNYVFCNGTAIGNLYSIGNLTAADGIFSRKTCSLDTIIDGTSNTIALAESLLAFANNPGTTTNRRAWCRMHFNDIPNASDASSYANVDLLAHALANPPSGAGMRGFPWLSSRGTATGFSTYYTPNFGVPGNWVRGAANSNYNFSSSDHTNGINTCYADGSVHFINNSIQLAIWQAASTAGGNEAVSLP